MSGVIVGTLASLVPTYLGKWLANRRQTGIIDIGRAKISVDLSEPEKMAAALNAHAASPRVFLAYSHQDRAYVDRLAEDLESNDLRVWDDTVEIQPGDRIGRRIKEGLNTSGYVLAVLSKSSVKSPWTTKEIDAAMAREREGKWPRVIAVVVDEVTPPTVLRDKAYVDLREDYEGGLARIVEAIRGPIVMDSEKTGD